jgi:DHA1 family bicyclomycin/chloramphenicol resistance-like MFS transporter
MILVAALSILGPFSVDTYFPSFPELASHFHVTELEVQYTLTFYLVALAVMSLFHGALSDSFGRRRVILVCLAIYSVSALGCIVAPNFETLLALRTLQGLTGGAGFIVSRALIRDRFDGVTAHRFMAQSAVFSGLGPVLAPIIGGWLQVAFGWRGSFAFLGILGASLWCASYYHLSESLPPTSRHPFHPNALLRAYGQALSHGAFVSLCLCMALGGGGFLVYVATAPDVVMRILGLKETQFGWLFFPIVIGLVLGSAVSNKLAGRVSFARISQIGFASMALGAVINLASNYLWVQRIPWAMMPVAFYTFGCSLTAPVFTVRCLDLFPKHKGLASSLQGFSQIAVFALISGQIPPLVFGSGVKHAAALALLLMLSALFFAIYVFLSRKARRAS